MIFGKTKKDNELETEDRPLESAAINRWRSINVNSASAEVGDLDEHQTLNDSLKIEITEHLHENNTKEQIQVLSLDQVFEEDETKVIRIPEDRDDIDPEEITLFDYQARSTEEDEPIESLLTNIEIEETRITRKTPKSPPLEKANFDISSEEDLKNRFGDNIQSALGSGTMIEGRFSFETPVRIDGSMRGEIKSSSALIVGKNATVNANIKVGALIILGSVEGEIEAEDLIEIRSSGTLLGDVLTRRIALEEGGVFSGRCTMVD